MLMFLSLKCWTKSLWFDRNLSLLMDYIYLSIVNNPWNLCWGNFLWRVFEETEFFIDFKLWHCRDLMFYADDTFGSILHYITSTASAAWCWNSRYEILESMAGFFFLSHRFPIILPTFKEKSISLLNMLWFFFFIISTWLIFKCINAFGTQIISTMKSALAIIF